MTTRRMRTLAALSALLALAPLDVRDVAAANLGWPGVQPVYSPTGTWDASSAIACPGNSTAGSSCFQINIHYPKTDDLLAKFSIFSPSSGALNRTVIVVPGSPGTSFFGGIPAIPIVNDLAALGYQVIQVLWVSNPQIITGFPGNMRTANARYATLFKFLNLTFGGTGAWCGYGHSAGGGALQYAATFFGEDAFFDAIMDSTGPAQGDGYLGCRNPASTTTLIDAALGTCAGVNGPQNIAPGGYFDNWLLDTSTCGAAVAANAHDDASYKFSSLDAPDGVFFHPHTLFSFFQCTGNEAAGVGSPYVVKLNSAGSSITEVECAAGGSGATCGTGTNIEGYWCNSGACTAPGVGYTQMLNRINR